MQKDIHPSNYRPCVFKDMGTEEFFITRSCAETRDNIEIDGVEYPSLDEANRVLPESLPNRASFLDVEVYKRILQRW